MDKQDAKRAAVSAASVAVGSAAGTFATEAVIRSVKDEPIPEEEQEQQSTEEDAEETTDNSQQTVTATTNETHAQSVTTHAPEPIEGPEPIVGPEPVTPEPVVEPEPENPDPIVDPDPVDPQPVDPVDPINPDDVVVVDDPVVDGNLMYGGPGWNEPIIEPELEMYAPNPDAVDDLDINIDDLDDLLWLLMLGAD